MEASVRERGERVVGRANRNMAMQGRSWVYFAQAGEHGPVKIGQSRQVDRRLIALNSASPVPVILLGTIPETVLSEREAHTAFRSIRLHGEWFKPISVLLELADAGRRVYGKGYVDVFDEIEASALFFDARRNRIISHVPRNTQRAYDAILAGASPAEIDRIKAGAA